MNKTNLTDTRKSPCLLNSKALAAILFCLAASVPPVATMSQTTPDIQQQQKHTLLALIPRPTSALQSKGSYQLPLAPTISISATQKSSAEMLSKAASYLQQVLLTYAKSDASIAAKGDITLATDKKTEARAYKLTIEPTGITLRASDADGFSAGIATLSQLLLSKGHTLPCLTISDGPQYEWRGFHLDVSRHFFTVAEVKHIIDLMALYKLNRFHWHLTDDQGWRIEIKKYPLLTEKGAWRIFNDQDSVCRRQAVATDDPMMTLPEDRIKVVGNDSLYGGFYTQDEIRDIVAYARKRGIETIPEIDMPGHFLSAIENYEGLSCFPKAGWGEFFTTPLCPGKDKALDFCKDIWREVLALFPFEYVHIGGDEVRRDTWEQCPDCQKRLKEEKLKDEDELQAWFIRQIEDFLSANGRRMLGWDEILDGGLSQTSTVTWWRTWVPDAPLKTIDHGNDVIFCPGAPMYLSQTEQKGNIRDIYEFDISKYLGKTFLQHAKTKKTGKTRKGQLLGVQGNLWTEYIPTVERAFYHYFPRIMALSELAWSTPENRDYNDFSLRMTQHFSLLQQIGIPYHSPSLEGFYSINAFTREGTLKAYSADPTAIIRYTTDGTIPTAESTLYDGPVSVDQTTDFKIRIFSPDDQAGETVDATFVKQGMLEPLTVNKELRNGLEATWYDFREYKCTNMHRCPVRAKYTIDDVVIPEEVRGHIGLIIRGFIRVPEDGIYTFALKSDDGSTLSIDGNLVVDNDHPQSPHEEVAQQALRAGLHAIEVRYYDHNGGMLRLNVFDNFGNLLEPKRVFYN